MIMIKAVVFDFGGVLKTDRFEGFMKVFSERIGVDPEKGWEFYKDYRLKLGAGMEPKEFCDMIKERFQVDFEWEKPWKECYEEAFSINEKVFDIVKELRGRYKVALITNVAKIHVDMIREKGFYDYFDVAVISCDIGIAKPDPKIYEILLEKIGLPAEECVFIDDRESDIKQAKEMGFKSVLFKDAEQLENDLKKLGINL